MNKYKIIVNYLYFLFFLIYLINSFFISEVSWRANDSLINTIQKEFTVFCLLLFFSLYLLEIVINQDFLYYLILVPITIVLLKIIGNNIENNDLVFTVAIVFLSKHINFDKIADFYFKIMSVGLVLIILFSKVGITKNVYVTFPYGTGQSLGFPHPNTLGITVLVTILAWVYLNYKTNIIVIFFVAYLGALFNWIVPLARTSAIVLILLPWVILIYRYSDKLKLHSLYYCSIFFILVAFGISIILMFNIGYFSNNFSSKYSSFYVRFTTAKSLYDYYGIHLLGSNIPFVSTADALKFNITPVILDCAYLRMLIYNGLISTITMTIIFLVLGYRIYKCNNQILMVILVMFIILGFMEHVTFLAQWNFVLLGAFADLKSKCLLEIR